MKLRVGQRWMFDNRPIGTTCYIAEIVGLAPFTARIVQKIAGSFVFSGDSIHFYDEYSSLTLNGPEICRTTKKINWTYLEGQDKP